MSARKGLVSIVMPAYNCAGTVLAAVESCLAQTWARCEIIVSDDGSTDGTVERLAALRDRITVLRKPNGGVASARNLAVAAAHGEFIAWMDADDLAHPDRIRTEVQALRRCPEAVLVSSDFSAFRDGADDFDRSHIGSYYRAVRKAGGVDALYDEVRPWAQGKNDPRLLVGNAYERLVRGNFVHFGTVLLRRFAWDRAGPLDESLRYGCEYDHLLRVARLGPFAYIDAPLLRYRRSASQLSHEGGHGSVPLDTVAILDKLRREDPELARRSRRLFRMRYAQAYLEASEAMSERDRREAGALLLRSLRFGPRPSDAARVTAKLALPRRATSILKRALGPMRRAAHTP